MENNKELNISDLVKDEKEIKEDGKFNFREKAVKKAKSFADKQSTIMQLNEDEEFQKIEIENKQAMGSSGWISAISPTLGMVIGVGVAILNMGLDEDQVRLIWSMLIGNIIGNAAGGFISWKNTAAMITNRTRMVWLYSKNMIENLKTDNNYVNSDIEEIRIERDELKRENKILEKELYDFRVREAAGTLK